jgi:PAP2 superfamily
VGRVVPDRLDRQRDAVLRRPTTNIGWTKTGSINTAGWREAGWALCAYGAYLLVRRVVWTDKGRGRATDNARRVEGLERRAHLHVEPHVQGAVLRAPRLVDIVNAGYAAGNVALSVGWLMRLHQRGDPRYRAERRAAMVAFVGALPVFALFPTAPPRTLDGFVDTLAARGFSLDHPFLIRFYNPIAAMPSHHVAFAVVTGVGLARGARGPWRRTAWRGYPVAIGLIVMATGNHFAADVVGGALLGSFARKVAR